MSDIALRDYDYEIEAMIESGDIDAAIAHCKHILTKYPKHLAVYRLLGSALMHAERHAEAIQVYHRLLSASPDDFETHYNLGVMHAAGAEFDQALWHMLRAFEIQPSNKSVHEKLREIYTIRDGKAPQIRLTRPALARMYASQPEQAEQAVSEILGILADEPDRIDLEVLLAQVLFRDQKYAEAEDACIGILTHLPFSFEANLILAEIYGQSDQEDRAEMHWLRVKEIDPYDKRFEKHISEKHGFLAVDDSAIEPLEGGSAEPESTEAFMQTIREGIEASPLISMEQPQPQSAAEQEEEEGEDIMLNFSIDENEEEGDIVMTIAEEEEEADVVMTIAEEDEEADVVMTIDETDLSWLAETPDGTAGASPEETGPKAVPVLPAEPSAAPETGADPNATGQPALTAVSGEGTGEEIILPDFSFLEEVEEGPAFLAPEELPDWLKEIPAKTQESESLTPPFVEEAQAAPAPPPVQPAASLPSWLINLAAKKESRPKAEQVPETQETPLPEPQSETFPEGIDIMQQTSRPTEQLPDWLRELESESAPQGEKEILASRKEELPAWLSELEDLPDEPPQEAKMEDLPDWLSELDLGAEHPETSVPVKPGREALPDWLQELDESYVPSAQEEMRHDEMRRDEMHHDEMRHEEILPDWLRALEEMPDVLLEQPTPYAETVPIEQSRSGEIIGEEWSIDLEEPETGVMDVSKDTGQTLSVEEVPEWLKDLDQAAELVPQVGVESEAAEDLPDWLRIKEEISAELSTSSEEEMPGDAELPAWLRDLEQIETATQSLVSAEPPVAEMQRPVSDADEVPPSGARMAAMIGEESMEEQSIDFTVDETEEENEPFAERKEKIPDWLVEEAKMDDNDMMESETPSAVEEPEFENIGAALDWLENITAQAEPTLAGTEEAIAADTPSAKIEEMLEMEEEKAVSRTAQVPGSKWVLEAAPILGDQPSGEPARTLQLHGDIRSSTHPAEGELQPRQMGLVNINKATLAQLEKLPGMGFRQAQNIINYRQIKGEIHSLDELRHVPKIDARLLVGLEPIVVFSDPEPMPLPRASEISSLEIYSLAQAYLSQGEVTSALEQYSQLIEDRDMLNEVILDLERVDVKTAQDIQILEALGDAYVAAERFEDALETYRKAEELLQ